MKLYYAPATCSLAVHIALRETGQTFDAVAVDLAKHASRFSTNRSSSSGPKPPRCCSTSPTSLRAGR